MRTGSRYTRVLTVFAAVAVILSFNGNAFAVDDGARAYWKAREGTTGVSFQFLNLSLGGSDAKQFAPDQYIYPNADVDANMSIVTFAHHFTMPALDRPSSLALTIAGGNVDADIHTNILPSPFLPPGVAPGGSLSQSSSGFADPALQLVMNLFGTPPLRSNVDLLNYEPTWTLDAAAMVAIPIGEYDDDKLVNIGLNRWYGRVGLPFKYHFGVFTPGYMNSLEITPSVWLFDENDDFAGHDLENDPLWQLEAHLTHDFTPSFFGSLDMLYRSGFQSEIDGHDAGDDLDIGNLGFTLNYQVTDNLAIRTGFSSNVFGDNDLDNSLIRIQFTYGWNQSMENAKKLMSGH